MAITKAIITTAGFGTRFLPITKTIQKEMLPILNRPLVDYVVQDCIKAGITDIIFVINEHNSQILHYYRENRRLYEYLHKMNKVEAYESVAHLHSQANFHFVRQQDSDPYGTAVPVMLCENYVKDDEAFLVFMGDDFIYTGAGPSEAAAMIELFQTSGAGGVATCIERPTELLHKYGVAEVTTQHGHQFLTNLIEKPSPGTAPSNLANISKYILTPAIFEIIQQQAPNSTSGELYITDSVLTLAQRSQVAIHTPQGEYLDGGFPLSWLKANLRVAKDDPELYRELRQYVQTEFLT